MVPLKSCRGVRLAPVVFSGEFETRADFSKGERSPYVRMGAPSSVETVSALSSDGVTAAAAPAAAMNLRRLGAREPGALSILAVFIFFPGLIGETEYRNRTRGGRKR